MYNTKMAEKYSHYKPQHLALLRAVSYYPSKYKFTQAMGICRQQVFNWLIKRLDYGDDICPPICARRVEHLTNGGVKAHELCPASFCSFFIETHYEEKNHEHEQVND